MVEQIPVLVSKNLKFFCFFMLVTCHLYSCKHKDINKNKSNNIEYYKTLSDTDFTKVESFKAKVDSLRTQEQNTSPHSESISCDQHDQNLNGYKILNNSIAFSKAFSKVTSAWNLNDRIYILSSDSTKYASFGVSYGGKIHEYRDVKVIDLMSSYVNDYVPNDVKDFIKMNIPESNNYKKFYFTTSSNSRDFVSGKGIKLGITEKDVEEKISKPYNKTIHKDSIIFDYKDDLCLYYEKYILVKNKLIEFSFGFENP